MILDGASPASVAQAADTLARGELVAFPTETVYGLGANALDDTAVAKIFEAKGRPADHPLIVHVAQASGVDAFAADVPAFAQRLMDALWPGPLTLILARRAGVAAAAAGGQVSIGLRCPSHPVAHALLLACMDRGLRGIAGPSANRFGRVSPTTAQHVQSEFGVELLVLDGGPCDVGIESTIVDCTRGVPVLLRPGMLAAARIEQAAGQGLRAPSDLEQAAPRASGTLESHYAPNAKVRLMDAEQLQTALDVLGNEAQRIAIYSRVILKSPSSHVIRRRMPDDAAETARQLFAVLREFDAQRADLIWVEAPPEAPEWDGVRDRLRRAAAG